MSDYTPITAEVRNSFSLHCESFCKRCKVSESANCDFHEAEFDRWLAEVKAQAWEEGAIWQRANTVPDDRRMKARFVSELQAMNPYRDGEK